MRFALSLCAALAITSTVFAQDPKAPFPRRLLFVQVADYLYVNPLTAAPREAAPKLAAGLRLPNTKDNDQLFIVSDAAADSPLPTKDLFAKALDGFCATTRAQDRVVLYFGCHAVEKDGKAFAVPIDGDPAAPATLLPVADVYAKLKDLKAAQKVVVWDVCRHNPERARARRDPGPMTPALFKALTAAPEGVQVLVSCSAGERATEFFAAPAPRLTGSLFLAALGIAAGNYRTANPKEMPGDEIFMEGLHESAVRYVARVAKQTPALAGTAVRQPAAYDAKEAPAKRFELPAAPKQLPEAKVILDELALPPLLEGDGSLARFPFAEAALKGYAADVSTDEILKNADKYPLRAATLRALQAVRDVSAAGRESKLLTAISAPVNDRTRRTVADAQLPIAQAVARLELELDNLRAVAGKRDKEPKRWQAHHDFALAELRLRIVVLNEYNLALAHVRTEALPDLPAGATGWRLVPSAKVEGRKDAQAMFAAADEGFAKLAADHKGTPWEVLARRSRATLPGVRWEPVK
jgi:hypothetical protein